MNQPKRRPDRMIATKHKAVSGAAKYRLHPAPVCLDASSARIMETPAVYCAPEVPVEFEVGAAPLPAHSSKDHLEVLLRFRVCAVESVPRPPPPTAEGDQVRAQRLALGVFHKPLRVPLEDM